MYIGAFGVVHKGEFVDVDGAMMPVAIKTIKCKYFTVTVYVLVMLVIITFLATETVTFIGFLYHYSNQ